MSGKTIHICLSLFFMLLAGCRPLGNDDAEICSQYFHDFVPHDRGKLVWSLPDVYVIPANLGNGTMLAATPEMVLVAGKTSKSLNSMLFAYDTSTGNRLWEKKIDLPVLLASYQNRIYYGSYNRLEVFDSRSDEYLEAIMLPQAGNILSLYAIEQQLFVYGSSGKLITYDLATRSITSSASDFTNRSFLIDNNMLFFHKGSKFGAINIELGSQVWELDIQEPFANPVFTDDLIFLRTGNPIYAGNIYAIDKYSGQILWKKDINIISNIEAQGSLIFFLTDNGALSVFNQQTGEEIIKLEFSPNQIGSPTLGNNVGGYYVAFDPTMKIVFASLGDSCQLFAIELSL